MRLSVSRAVQFGTHLKELRIHLCQVDSASKGVRDFIQKNYVSMKKKNPSCPILIRECSGVEPRLWARYAMGKENSVSLTNLGAADVVKQIEILTHD